MPETTTAPGTDSNKQLIDMLRRSRLFRDYESVFSKATGLPLALRPADYWQLEHQGKKNENPFCALLAEQQNSEPPMVRKAREYIDKHKTEPLSLAAVASAAGASVFHFCKVFRKSTGLRFTDYVTRVRLEEARTQLLNPGRRISEVA